jgi:hypothetical protein
MTTEPETYQYVFDLTTEHEPLYSEDCNYFMSRIHNPDSTCRELNDYGKRLFGHPVYIFYDVYYYGVIGVNDRMLDYKYFLWNLGETPSQAKRWLFKEYLYQLYCDKDVPYHITNLHRKACNAYDHWLKATWNLIQSLHLKDGDLTDFMDWLEMDCRHDGGINCDNLVLGYWIKKMVEEKLLQFDPDRDPKSIQKEFVPQSKPKREPKEIGEEEGNPHDL